MFKISKSTLWVKKCGRSDRGFESIDDVTKDTYFYSLPFRGGVIQQKRIQIL